jgi:hypothetical protein
MIGLVDQLWYAMYVVGFRGVNVTAFWLDHSQRAMPSDLTLLTAWHRATYNV